MFSLCLIFCGVLASPSQFPRFWIFMYRLSPFTYMVSGMLSVGLANSKVHCAPNEFVHFDPPQGSTCGEYIADYKMAAGGYMQNDTATTDCSFCSIEDTNTFLKLLSSDYSQAWRNFGILWAYCIFNVIMALVLYWLVRMPKKAKKEKDDKTPAPAAVDAPRQGSHVSSAPQGEKNVEASTTARNPSTTPATAGDKEKI
jgi:ATP-binding cassette subfamily G (WHITE) protein 2 (PDR)